MLDISSLFLSAAWAQDAAAAAPPADSGNAAMMNYLPLVLIFAVFYFMVIRPQQKKLSDQDKMVKALQRGDRVVFSGGLHGKIAKIEGDDLLFVEIADGVQVKVDRTAIQNLEAKPQPVMPVVEDGKK